MQTLAEKKDIFSVSPQSPALSREQATTESLPLSFAQQRLWFFSQLEPDSPLYNIPTALRLVGTLDVDALKKSLNAIVNRHEALRTNFVSEAGTPVQVIKAQATLELSVVDLSALPIEARHADTEALLLRESQKPFELANDLLLRATLFRMASQEHILFLNMHHIVSDEWSLRVFFRELSAFYSSFTAAKFSALPEMSIQYADFALWQREFLSGEFLENEIAYWKNQLGNNRSPADLPTDHSRPAVQSYKGGSKLLDLPEDAAKSIRELSRREGVTLFMTLAAAFKTLLHRYTGEEQVTIGSPISGRNKVETENLIGFFVNTLVLRTNVSGEVSFREFLGRVRETTLGAYAHQELPFEKLVEELQPERTSGQVPFIQAMFTLQNAGTEKPQLAGLEIEFIEVDTKTAKFDLTLVARETQEGLRLVLEYNTDLYDGATVERILGHYGCLLEAIVAAPGEKISRLNLLGEAERQQLLVDWNQTQTDYPHQKCIHQLFEEQVEKSPDAVALVFGEEQLTYRELNQRADQLALHLRECGVEPDTLVGICLERSLELIIGLLAILKAGGAYVPLDASLPEERLQFMLQDTALSRLITDQPFSFSKARKIHPKNFATQPSPFGVPPSGGGGGKVGNLAADRLKAELQTSPENLAYVMYTSGSTGQPKGVAIPHRGVVRLVRETNFMRFGSEEVFLQFAPVSFDASTLEIWGSLLHGARLVIYPPHLPSLEELGATLQQHRITTLWLTAGLFHQMVEHQIESLRGVKQLLAGGDVLSVPHVRKVLEQLPECQLINGYGPTESTTFTCCYPVPKNWPGHKSVPIGRPISNTQVYILDAHLQPAPIGVAGELFIGGDGLARGYLNRPELNAEKFVPNPFLSGERLYKTGDKVRYLAEGTVEFLGRMDNQVKLRGYRIELEEIEAVLAQHPFVRQATVLVHTNPKTGKYLAAYAALKTPHEGAVAELKQFLKRKLPAYMAPTAIFVMNELPLTPNGKVDKKALIPPDLALIPTEDYVPPRSPLETRLQSIWQSVLGKKPIGIHDNFFDLGGHSLLAVRLFAQIETTLGKKLPLSLLFQSPTIEQLAKAIEDNNPVNADPCLVEIQPNGSRPPIFWLHTLGGGGGGGVVRYQKLSQLLGPDQPSYGLVAPPEPFSKIERMAEHYIKSMRVAQPAGPYHLAGYCFGGVIAFEMAQQLRAKGEEVALLALLDSAPANISAAATTANRTLQSVAGFPKRLKRFLSQNPAQIVGALKRRWKKLERKVAALRGKTNPGDAPSRRPLDEVIDMSEYPADYKRYAEVHWNALVDYWPKVYPGKITLFQTTNSSATMSPEFIWKPLGGDGLDIKRIPGSHEKMLEDPHVQTLAAEFKKCLDQCRQGEVKGWTTCK